MEAQAVFFACGFGALGIILVIIGSLSVSQALVSQRWPTAPGEIVASGVQCWNDGDVPQAKYQARVEYTYTVKGQLYQSSRINLRESHLLVRSRPDEAQEIIQQYPLGKTVTVYYHPSDPARAVLHPFVDLPAYAPLFAGGLFFIISLFAMMFAFTVGG